MTKAPDCSEAFHCLISERLLSKSAENGWNALTLCFSTQASKQIAEIRFYAIFLRQVVRFSCE